MLKRKAPPTATTPARAPRIVGGIGAEPLKPRLIMSTFSHFDAQTTAAAAIITHARPDLIRTWVTDNGNELTNRDVGASDDSVWLNCGGVWDPANCRFDFRRCDDELEHLHGCAIPLGVVGYVYRRLQDELWANVAAKHRDLAQIPVGDRSLIGYLDFWVHFDRLESPVTALPMIDNTSLPRIMTMRGNGFDRRNCMRMSPAFSGNHNESACPRMFLVAQRFMQEFLAQMELFVGSLKHALALAEEIKMRAAFRIVPTEDSWPLIVSMPSHLDINMIRYWLFLASKRSTIKDRPGMIFQWRAQEDAYCLVPAWPAEQWFSASGGPLGPEGGPRISPSAKGAPVIHRPRVGMYVCQDRTKFLDWIRTTTWERHRRNAEPKTFAQVPVDPDSTDEEFDANNNNAVHGSREGLVPRASAGAPLPDHGAAHEGADRIQEDAKRAD